MRKYLALLLSAALLLTSCANLVDEVVSELNGDSYGDIEWDDDYDYDYEDDTMWLSDFDDACYGAPISGAAEYNGEAGLHPVAIFDRDSDMDSFYNMNYVLPEAWEASYDNPEDAELVVCLTAVPGEFVEACEYDIEGTTYFLNNYDATYQTELYEAATGALVAETMLDAPAEECPMFWYFYDTSEDYYSSYDEPLKSWIKAYVQI